MKTLPIIGIMGDFREEEGRGWIKSPSQYKEPVEHICHGVPIIIPPMHAPTTAKLTALLARLDGVILSGSPSNIKPEYYGQAWQTPELLQDSLRDATALAMVPLIIAQQMPLFAICRGFQEVNVALGGTLHQKVHELSPYHDHRGPKDQAISAQYSALQHEVRVTAAGRLAQVLQEPRFMVNSLHGQGVDKLAEPLQAEAHSDDGLLEAYSLPDHPFFLAVQWHPEWRAETNPQSQAMFAAFGEACCRYQKLK